MSAATRARRSVALVLAIAGVLAMVSLSRLRWRNPDAEAAELRLSWRIPAPSERSCRPPTEAELEGVLPHMRPSEVCTDEAIPYRLTVLLDGDTLRSGPVARAGGRIRAITVYERFVIAPGDHRITVGFAPETASAAEAVAMAMDADVAAAPGDVILVATDDTGRLGLSEGR
ncbi:MAG: hypothetical protein OXK77_08435 [Gemmatimonadota bacterium]|nr:hypothetical protein [Gemmatimonadota bacterium]MDE2865069.1 hypothetical protein [Gemmatimonadota bacterium]MYB05624.1 hypothetical protein [Gemmatimonadota bacterium]MYG22832.1 hypothetical protein [Gemmatimonadota bacterium]MYJ40792.1 hypothetical protein [Gemmatimonadota bacterium]